MFRATAGDAFCGELSWGRAVVLALAAGGVAVCGCGVRLARFAGSDAIDEGCAGRAAVAWACGPALAAGGVIGNEAIGAWEPLGVASAFDCARSLAAGPTGTLAARADPGGTDLAEAVGAARVSGAAAADAEKPAPAAAVASATDVGVDERGAVPFFDAVFSVDGVTVVPTAATALAGADVRACTSIADAAGGTAAPANPAALADAEARA
ncbi:hypothetical protein [Caballeronia sp. GAWG1-5s-s]|uniref:hypothetical protein n=1 Tax=Caballeronia sp. GAWG1-5s-s TaxID=2921743 RepID=UPI0020291381|nr:hypothetical protein [Caballeronia sp. GAWG1-5s-s]